MKMGKALKTVQGEERTGDVPQWGRGILEGAAVIGYYAGADSYTTQDKDADGKAIGTPRNVVFIKLVDVIKFTPNKAHSDDGTTELLPVIGVPLNADTKEKLNPQTLKTGQALLIQFTKTETDLNNMRRYRVESLTPAQYDDVRQLALLDAKSN